VVSERHLRRLLRPWLHSRNLADSIIATSVAPPDRAQSTIDSTLTAKSCLRGAATRAPRALY
jgi:hypothetical protein